MNSRRIAAIILTACLSACAVSPPHAASSTDVPVPGLAPGVHFAGGDGSSREQAVIVLGANEMTGVSAEYLWLDAHFPGYKRGTQSLLNGQGGKSYDVLDFTMPDGSKQTVYFDISDYFGKF